MGWVHRDGHSDRPHRNSYLVLDERDRPATATAPRCTAPHRDRKWIPAIAARLATSVRFDVGRTMAGICRTLE